MAENNYIDSVDQILGELKKQRADPPAAADNRVDDILASLGKGEAPSSAAVMAAAVPRQPAPQQVAPQPPAPQPPAPQPPAPQQAAPQRMAQPSAAPQAAAPTPAAPSAAQDVSQPETTLPELSGSIQMDEQFQNFFQNTVAVIPDEKEQERPGFFARFLQRYKADEDDFVEFDDEEDQDDEPSVLMPSLSAPLHRRRLAKPQPAPQRDAVDLHNTQSFAPAQPPAPLSEAEQVNLDATQPFDAVDAGTQQAKPAQATGQIDLMQDEAPAGQDVRGQHTGSIQFDIEADDAYGEYDEYDEYDGEEARPALPLRLLDWLRHQLGSAQEPDAEPFEEPFAPSAIAEYTDPEDAPAIAQDLATRRLRLGLRCAIGAVLTVLLFLLSMGGGAAANLPAIAGLTAQDAPSAWLGVQLVVLLLVCAINWQAFANGLKGLVFAPSVDTMPALAGVAGAVQLVCLLLSYQTVQLDTLTVFAAAAALLLVLNALGHYLSAGVTQRNFAQLQAEGSQTVTTLLQDASLSQELAEGLGEPEPRLLVSRSTGMVQNVLHRSFSQSHSTPMQQKLAWALGIASLLSLVLCLVAGHDFAVAVGAFAGTLCLGGALASSLVVALPASMMQKSAAQVGAVVPGASAVAQLKEANVIVADAIDLVPPASVRLHGIKTFDKQRIDLAILYTASILIEGCEILKDVFMDMIQDKTEILYAVENLENHPGMGFSGWVENNRTLVGTRDMMSAQGIEVPSMDFENRYTKGTRNAMYLAVSGQLFAMFTISYRPSTATAETLYRLHRQGISVLVKSDDFNLTGAQLCALYDLPQGSVQVLSAEKRRQLAPQTGYVRQSDACMAHNGSFASFVGGLGAAIDAALGERTAGYVLAAGVLFSCALALVLSFGGGLASLGLPAVALYQAAWCVLTLVMTLLRRL